METKFFKQLHFTALSEGQNDLLVALLSDMGYDGFEEDATTLKAFIPKENFDSAILDEIIKIIPVTYSISEIEDVNWNSLWESSFQPIVINDRVAIRAGFHPAFPDVRYDIVITPKMSFGTGHHATTCLMIERMLDLDFNHKAVLDFGTGTGILAILAEKMGAHSTTAIDNDDWSIENAGENISANNCRRIAVQKAETISSKMEYDIILANINLNVILSNLATISAVAKPGATLLFSGFLISDEPLMVLAFIGSGLQKVSVLQQQEWICIHALKL